jgi:hypothetical protein
MEADISALEEFQKTSVDAEELALTEITRRENIVKLDCAKQFLGIFFSCSCIFKRSFGWECVT